MFDNLIYFSFDDPIINLIDNDNEYVVELCATGLTKEDLNLKVSGTNLIVKSKKKLEDKQNYLIRRFQPEIINVKIPLPDEFNSDDEIRVELINGILRIHFKKSEKKNIKIKFE